MTTNTLAELPRYRHPSDGGAIVRGDPQNSGKKADACTPIIDADETNEALKTVARIRKYAGPGEPADDPGLEILFEKRE